jgi:oligoribonuclease NrnB/cAMP/cGMP phosphodiesterase (DHH superfamily)
MLLARQPRTAIVLDHHKGAEEIVRSFGELGVFADEKLEPGVSGAVLAFREVWEPIRAYGFAEYVPLGTLLSAEVQDKWGFPMFVRDFAECVGARDTWQTESPKFLRGQWISKMIMSKPAHVWLGDDWIEPGNTGILPHQPYFSEAEIGMGRALFEMHEETVRQAVEQCVLSDVHGCGLAVFQEQASGFRLCSDVSETMRGKLTQSGPGVVAGFSYVVDKPGAEPHLVYSLRGLNGFDVSVFAKANGGGGHTAAAGFSTTIDACLEYGSPYDFIRRRLGEFLE